MDQQIRLEELQNELVGVFGRGVLGGVNAGAEAARPVFPAAPAANHRIVDPRHRLRFGLL